MSMSQGVQRYAEAEVTVADPKRVLLLMFEGGLRFLRGARDGLANDDLACFMYHSQKAQGVISELLGTLDHDAGGDIARNLGRLYEFMLFHMTEGTAKRSVRHYDEVIRVFDTVADAYRQVLTAPVSGPVAA